MKYGVIVYQNTRNIGDDIQSYSDQLEESRQWLTKKNSELEAALREKEKELETQHAWSEEQEKAKEWLSVKVSELEAALRGKERELEQSAACCRSAEYSRRADWEMGLSRPKFGKGVTGREILLSMACFSLLILASYGVLLPGQAATDTYSSLYWGDTVNWSGWMALGRFTAVLFKQILFSLHLNTMNPTIQTIFLMAATVLSMEWIFVSFRPLFKGGRQLALLGACVALVFVNPFYAEWFLFPECYFMFGLSAVLCAAYVHSVSGTMNAKKWFISLLLVILAVNCYQSNLSFCLIFVLAARWMWNGGSLSLTALKELACGIVHCAIAAVSNLVLMSVAQAHGYVEEASRTAEFSLEGVIANIKTLIADQAWIMDSGMGIMQGKWIAGLWILIAAALFIKCAASVAKQKAFDAVALIVLGIGMYASVFAIQMLSGNLWLAQRTIAPFFAAAAGVALLAFDRENRLIKGILLAAVPGFVLVSIVTNQMICTERMITNRLDLNEAQAILNEITEYEQENNVDVTNIRIVNDTNPTWAYPGIHASHDINVRAMAYPRVAYCLLNIAGDQRLEMVIDDSGIFPLETDRDQEHFDLSRQFLIAEDTAYLILY